VIFFITHGKNLTQGQLLLKVRAAAMEGVDYILLRENHLSHQAYLSLAQSVQQMLSQSKTQLVVCHRPKVADLLGVKLHSRFQERLGDSFSVSTHSVEEMLQVKEDQFCFYGNVFETDCKKGLAGRGPEALGYHKQAVALGGVTLTTAPLLVEHTKNIGLMSSWQTSEDIGALIRQLRQHGF